MSEEILKMARKLLSKGEFEAFGGEIWLRAEKIAKKAETTGIEAAIVVELVTLRRQESNLANRDRSRPWRRLATNGEMQNLDPRRVKRQW